MEWRIASSSHLKPPTEHLEPLTSKRGTASPSTCTHHIPARVTHDSAHESRLKRESSLPHTPHSRRVAHERGSFLGRCTHRGRVDRGLRRRQPRLQILHLALPSPPVKHKAAQGKAAEVSRRLRMQQLCNRYETTWDDLRIFADVNRDMLGAYDAGPLGKRCGRCPDRGRLSWLC